MAIRNYDIGGMLARSGQAQGQQMAQGVSAFGQGLGNMLTGVSTGLEARRERKDEESASDQYRQILDTYQTNPTGMMQEAQLFLARPDENSQRIGKLLMEQADRLTASQTETEDKNLTALQEKGELALFNMARMMQASPEEDISRSNLKRQSYLNIAAGHKVSPERAMEILNESIKEDDTDKTTYGTTVTEWVSPTAPDKVVLKTIQPSDSAIPIQLGTNLPVSAEDLQDLQKRQGKPAVSVDLGDKTEAEYTKQLAKGVADLDLKILSDGASAENNLSTISEARLVLEQPGNDITGFGAENITQAKSAMLSLMGALGVSENDSLYQKLSNETSAANLYNTFTQLFVKERMEATKGAITEREFSTFIASVPNLLQTAEGYKQVLKLMERANTAAVLKAQHVENNMESQEKVRLAKKQWSSFSRQFPLGSISAEAMTTIFADFIKPNFNRDSMVISYVDSKTKERVKKTYAEISREARRNGISPQLALKRMFSRASAQHVPL